MNRFNVLTKSAAVLLTACAMLTAATSHAQQTTEQYVPIGESPGISDEYSYIGEIVSVDTDTHTIVVESNRGTKTIKITEATALWLDRTKVRRSNLQADYSDCEVGRKVEVMYKHADESVADWVKIESR